MVKYLLRQLRGGIPLGSALGPLLFLVYVNAMPSVVKFGKLLQFADDTTLIFSGSDIDTVKSNYLMIWHYHLIGYLQVK